MKYLIVCRRRLGVALDRKELHKAEPILGDIQISALQDETLGRLTISAWIFKTSPHIPDVLPPLLDVKITSMAAHGMNLTGLEKVGDALYSQSWWCRGEQGCI